MAALRAFTLIEVLIATALMSIIVLGLIATFSETQRAFRAGMTQVDVMEGGRSALEMMAREIEQTDATDLANGINFSVDTSGAAALVQDLPGSSQPRQNVIQGVSFCMRVGQEWTGVVYKVAGAGSVGTLYRYEAKASQLDPARGNLISRAAISQPARVIGGVVHLKVDVYDSFGRLLTGSTFSDNALPAYVDIELGIIEAKTVERAAVAPADYLTKRVGKVHIFRQRMPIRNAAPSV